MNSTNTKNRRFPPDLNRDRARPRTAPAPKDSAMEARLAELVSPATYALTSYYQQLGLRWRILNLPVMVAMVLAMVWRQVPSVSTLVRMVSREGLLWTPPVHVSQQAFDQRLSTLTAQLFGEAFAVILPTLLQRSTARCGPLLAVLTHALAHFDRLRIVDDGRDSPAKVGLLRDATDKVLAGRLLALLDLPMRLPVVQELTMAPQPSDRISRPWSAPIQSLPLSSSYGRGVTLSGAGAPT